MGSGLQVVTRAIAGTMAMLVLVSLLVFTLVRTAPGDPVEIQLGAEVTYGLTQNEMDALRQERLAALGLDRPLPEQYARWLGRTLTGDWGVSFVTGQPVATEVARRLPASVILGSAGILVAIVISAGFALASSRRPGSATDHSVRLGTLLIVAVPTFLLGTVTLQVAAGLVNYPIAGGVTMERLWLPALVLGITSSPTLSRVLRASLIFERGRLYAVAATTWGVSPGRVLTRHVLRPAISPALTLTGLTFASLMTASIITEAVFSWPGIGAYAVSAIAAQDYPVIQAYVVLATTLVVIINRSIDLLQRLVDPRHEARARAVA